MTDNRKKKILFIFGTRPEAIKIAPVIREALKYKRNFTVKVCVTAQHREMLDQVLRFFNIKPDYDLNLMRPNQTLFDISSRCLDGFQPILHKFKPDIVSVQGDTTSALIGAMGAMYQKIKIMHVEAGLRSGNKYQPFPEELNRILISHMADYHFAPSPQAVANLRREGVTRNVYQVGNTVVDALLLGLKIIKKNGEEDYYDYFKFLNFSQKIILLTCHRRENFGKPVRDIFTAVKILAEKFPEVQVVYPVHPNPNVKTVAKNMLSRVKNIHLISPLEYSRLIWLMSKSYLIISDSGGIQEEAPSLGKPLLVIREVTERPEIIRAGVAKLVGNDKNKIIFEVDRLLTDPNYYRRMSRKVYPYGDGRASKKIIDIIQKANF